MGILSKLGSYADGKKRQLQRKMSADAKAYYSTYVANDTVSPLNEQLVRDVLSYNPNSIFEFGCGVGKNLHLLRDKEHLGIDLSAKAIKIASKKGLNVICGDEAALKTIGQFDVVFTCSVLDHIENIDSIIGDLNRIANTAIVIAETNTKLKHRFYYQHDYESFGFVKTAYEYTSMLAVEPAVYHIWHFNVGSKTPS